MKKGEEALYGCTVTVLQQGIKFCLGRFSVQEHHLSTIFFVFCTVNFSFMTLFEIRFDLEYLKQHRIMFQA